MLTDALILGALIGLVRRGSLANLASLSFPFWWLIVLSFAFRLVLPYAAEAGAQWAFAAQVAAFGALLGGLAANLSKPWVWLVALGVLSNLLVVSANHGMPVSGGLVQAWFPDAGAGAIMAGDGIHVAMTERTLLPFLGDVLPFAGVVSPEFPNLYWQLVSIGDVAMYVGVMFFIGWAMMSPPGAHRQRTGLKLRGNSIAD